MNSIQDFYDQQWKSSGDDIFSRAFTEAIQQSYSFLGELKGKKVLEIGSGSGEQSVYFASQGALVTVIDISPESVKAVEKKAQESKVEITALQMDAEQLQFPAESFNLVYINSTLMHVHQQKVIQECSRVLKKGGKLVVLEPMKYASFVQIYRLFSSYRKMKPRYATFKMFKEGKKYFSDFNHREFYLFASLLLPVFYFQNNFFHKIYRSVAKCDQLLLKMFPFLRYACWVSVVEYSK